MAADPVSFLTRAFAPLLTDWPLSEPPNWAEVVNQPQTEAELKAIRRYLVRGSPYGRDDWMARTAESLGLESTLRPRNRPKDLQTNNIYANPAYAQVMPLTRLSFPLFILPLYFIPLG